MICIDLNCDMGESFGAYSLGDDEALMSYVSSVNIACGFHAGDPSIMRKTVKSAVRKGVAIGAHPGYPDLQGFGRREIKMTPDEVFDLVLYQVGALSAFVRAEGVNLYHVKPHGALYNVAAKDQSVAMAIASAVHAFDKNLFFIGLSGSKLIEAGKTVGLKTVNEVFADRTYQDDGSLTPRSAPNALIHNDDEAVRQVVKMALEARVCSVNGNEVSVKSESVCIHGDGKNALAFATKINSTLKSHGINIRRPG